MIIVRDKNIINNIDIPRNLYFFSSNYDNFKLVLKDRATNVEYVFDNLEDKMTYHYGLYSFDIDFGKLPQGEYEYKLINYEKSEQFIVDFNVWPKEEIGETKVNDNGELVHSPKERILIFELPTDYPYKFYAYGKYENIQDILYPAYFVNWMSEDGCQCGEYEQLLQYFDGVEIWPCGNATNLVYMNADYNFKEWHIRAYYEEEQKESEMIVAIGIIRIGALESNPTIYSAPDTYDLYDNVSGQAYVYDE